MKAILEKISILSLSLMLVSTFAVTPALPQMIAYFGKQGYAAEQVEFLMTITSFAIMATLLLNDVLIRFLSERAMVTTGLLLMAVGGFLPAVLSSYPLVFVSRILLGLGIGFINARAIQLIGSHYSGQERVTMLGLRGSAEVLGSASLTALVGVLIGFGWQAAFFIYLFALLILGLYWFFVPASPQNRPSEIPIGQARMDGFHWKMALVLAVLAYIVIVINTSLTMRIPVLVTQSDMGTASQASLVLSLMQLMGIVAGMAFRPLFQGLNRRLLSVSYLLFGLAVFAIGQASNLILLGLAAMVVGFLYSTVLTVVFHGATEYAQPHLAQKLMTLVLLGCNIGGATSSVLPNFLDRILPKTIGSVGVFAGVCVAVGILLWLRPLPEK